jgi:hypothetical protein
VASLDGSLLAVAGRVTTVETLLTTLIGAAC